MPFEYVFGPVPSRRLGISLGIDIVPFKTCSYNCIYCECGPTTRLTLERESFIQPDRVISEIEAALGQLKYIDFLTFSGSGEPTLNKDIGYFITRIKKLTSFPVAVLTNGSLLFQEDVKRDLLAADVVLPSLDAVSPDVFSRINRPHHQLNVSGIIRGLAEFRNLYSGKIWLEIFIVKGLTDGKTELEKLHAAIKKIRPDRVQLNSLDRPPAEPGVSPVDVKDLEDIRQRWSDLPVEIIKRVRRREEIVAFSENLEHLILTTIGRRPLTLEDLIDLTGKNRLEILKYIDILAQEKKIRFQIVGEKIFYRSAK
jgi:wyosine [tRNA(Phe)-imidazoG37] synthetase (radical SAM superfamily)